jgi:hypothetical protein
MPSRSRLIQLAAVSVAAAAVVLAIVGGHRTSTAPPPKPAGATAPPIGQITCDRSDHTGAPITVHLTILINGRARDIPAYLGYGNPLVAFNHGNQTVTKADCVYWVHTGADDGVIHADAPAAAHYAFTLGDVFDVWHLPLGTERIGGDQGPVLAYVNGHAYAGSPRAIPLTDHATIELALKRS